MEKIFNLKNLHYSLFCTIPLALITGPFLSDLFTSLISILFIYLSIRDREFKYYKNKLFVIFILWCLYLILLSILSDNPILSLESSLFFFRYGVFSIAIWYILEKNNNIIFYFFISILITFLILIVDGFYQFFFNANLLGNLTTHNARISSIFGDEYIMGSYLARMYPIFFGLVIFLFRKNHNWLFFTVILFILIDILIFISGERAAFLLLLLSSVAIIISIKRYKLVRIISILLSFLIISGIIAQNEGIKNRMINHTFDQLSIENYDNEEGFSKLHYSFAIVSIRLFYSEPLFGIGPKLFREQCSYPDIIIEDGCSTHPHNIYLQSLAETGLIGTIPIAIAFFYILATFLKQFYYSVFQKKYLLEDYEVCMYGALLVSFWPLIPTFSLFNNWVNVIVFLPIGFILYFSNQIKKS